MCILASTIIGAWTIAISCCIARDYLIFHLNLQIFVNLLFSIVCGLATDFALVYGFIIRSFIVATDEFADILLATVMIHESYL